MKKHIFVIFMNLLIFSRSSILGLEKQTINLMNQAEKASQFAATDAKDLIKFLVKDYKKSTNGLCTEQASGKCGSSLKGQEPEQNRKSKASAQLFIFVSSSMPQQTIRSLGKDAHKIGAKIVFRGLIGGTFQETQRYMTSLGIVAEIDPTKFDDYQVIQVPTFILAHKDTFDRVMGHISPGEALNQFWKKGDLKSEAQEFHQLLQRNRL